MDERPLTLLSRRPRRRSGGREPGRSGISSRRRGSRSARTRLEPRTDGVKQGFMTLRASATPHRRCEPEEPMRQLWRRTGMRSKSRRAATLFCLAVAVLTGCGAAESSDTAVCAATLDFAGRSYTGYGEVTAIPPDSQPLGEGVFPPCDDGFGGGSAETVRSDGSPDSTRRRPSSSAERRSSSPTTSSQSPHASGSTSMQ